MKVLIVLCLSLALASSNPVDLNITHLLSLSPGEIQNLRPSVKADASNVQIYYRSQSTSALGVQVDLNNPSSLTSTTDFSSSKKSVFVIHGWQNSHLTLTSLEISEAYLKAEDINLFVVDWANIAVLDYITAQLNVESIGQIVGGLIKALVTNNGLDVSTVAVVGHSLGAHIAGVAAKTAGSGLAYIVGMDPAGPLFSMENSANRLDKSDARFVQVIHTNTLLLGFNGALGHADYWPNGGDDQPGCNGVLDTTGLCRHSRSFQYFSESLTTGNFIATACASYDTYENGGCSGGATSWMGQIEIDTSASGNYYLDTNAVSPYALG